MCFSLQSAYVIEDESETSHSSRRVVVQSRLVQQGFRLGDMAPRKRNGLARLRGKLAIASAVVTPNRKREASTLMEQWSRETSRHHG